MNALLIVDGLRNKQSELGHRVLSGQGWYLQMLHGIGERTQQPQPRLVPGGADVVWASKLQHAVECVDGDVHLGRSTVIHA